MSGKALLFINGEPPESLPNLDAYSIIACTDGALNYLKKLQFPMKKLDFVSGDFDSHSGKGYSIDNSKFIFTPDQDKTDFEKALEILKEKRVSVLDVFGASGGEQDHFLGNLSVAYQYKNEMQITFFDAHSTYFFLPRFSIINKVKNKMISLYPFPEAHHVKTRGLEWNLHNETLQMTGKISTRNFAVEDEIEIQFSAGNLLIFIGADYA